MMRALILALPWGLCCVNAAYAQNVHLKHGSPTFTDNGLTLTAGVSLAGLGNQDLQGDFSATANPIATCTNPSGKNQPPGQNPAQVGVSATPVSIPSSQIKNGNVSFTMTTNPPTTPIPGAPDCPGSSWTENITDLQFTAAVITIEQPPPTVVLTVSCTFAPPTVNGPVAAGTVTCH